MTREEVGTHLDKYTRETGQKFEAKSKERVWELTMGQPWLVNALAYQVTFEFEDYRNRTKKIPPSAVESAKEDLIFSRAFHLDQFADKLKEVRVRREIKPLLTGESGGEVPYDDVLYCLDLGLIRLKSGQEREVSNPIYLEVISRELGHPFQTEMTPETKTPFVLEIRKLDFSSFFTSFQDFLRQHSESRIGQFHFRLGGFHLLLQAFLERIINGGGAIKKGVLPRSWEN